MTSAGRSSASAERRPDAVLAELEVLRRENAELRADNSRLRERLHLPAPPPAGPAPVLIPAPRAPGGLAGEFAAVLAGVLKVDTVAPDRHFITDLGADSLHRWLEEQGFATTRLASAKGFRVLEVRPPG